MSRFFTLGGREVTSSQHQQQEDTSNNFFLFKNQEIYNKGFELWHYYHHQKLQQDTDHSALGPSRRINGCDEPDRTGFTVTMEGGSGGTMNCLDCGNQAKKDCVHMRCRTCCKGRGFECSTHVKSTWVSASRRRERQQQFSGDFQQQNQDQDQQNRNQQQNMSQEQQRLSLGAGENPKRQRENQGLQLVNFPAEVNSPAVFRCVRVNSMDDTEEQYAYQTAVNIGGHVFKGILYDQGRDQSRFGFVGEGSSGGGGAQHGNLIAATATATATAASENPAGFTLHDPSSYPSQLNAFYMAGTQFFPPPRP